MKVKSLVRVAALAVGVSALAGCLWTGSSTSRLVDTASFDFNCPPSKIKVVSKHEGMGTGRAVLNVCGKMVKYKRAGNVYYRADKGPLG